MEKELVKYVLVSMKELKLFDEKIWESWIQECELVLTEHGLNTHGECLLIPENRYNELVPPKLIIQSNF